MLKLTKILLLLGLVTLGVQAAERRWWETASFYQIYPRSFKDSDGDGIGDIKGITQQLAYLKEIGITATWLSPIFTSPMVDFGYDISNFTEIDPMFGTMADFDELLKVAKALDVKIILDFVPNHSSDECEWFIKSAARDPEFEDFYVWHPGKMVNGERQPPTNWLSVFRGSAWKWHEGRKEYFLHQFVDRQPDFNYRNPKVVEAMNEILRFWLRKGVSGFRIDAVPHIFEATDASGNFADEPRNPNNNDPDDFGYLDHIYTVNQPETVDLIYEFRKVLDEHMATHQGEEPILMTEAYAPIKYLMEFYGNETTEGAQIPFNFELISTLNNNSNAYQYDTSINQWLGNMPKGRTANWVMGNHDKNRIGSRMGADRMDLINMMLLTLPGCSITFNGEEIGMTDVWISWEESVDPQGCNSSPEQYERLSRDPVRTPFQWNDSPHAGFTEGNHTWLPVAKDYKLVNVKRQRGIPMSHLNIYKQVQQLRRSPVFRNGDTEVKALSNNVLAIKRFLVGDYVYLVLLNIMDDVESLNLNSAFEGLSSELQYVVVTDKSIRRSGDRVFTDSVLLLPKEAVILRTTEVLKH